MFDNAPDAQAYLRRTVCMWDGHPVYIESIANGVGGSIIATVYRLPLDKGKMETIDISDKRFNCRLFNLGYMVTTTGQMYYVTRIPSREQPQGLTGTNLRFTGTADKNYTLSSALYDQGFVDMLKQQYMEPMKAVAELEANLKTTGIPIGRQLAVTRHKKFKSLYFLEYKGREISFSETLQFNLPTEFQYLLEVCEPTGIVKAA